MPKFRIFVVPILPFTPLPSEGTSSHPEEVEGHLIIDIDAVMEVDAADTLQNPLPSVLTGA